MTSSDQVSVLAVGLPTFATTVEHVSPEAPVDAGQTSDAGATAGPTLTTNKNGPAWLVTGCDATLPSALFWNVLRTKTTH